MGAGDASPTGNALAQCYDEKRGGKDAPAVSPLGGRHAFVRRAIRKFHGPSATGVPGDQISDVMQAMFAPAGTPKSIIDLLQKEVAKAVAAADVKSKLDSLGFEAIADTPEHFAARIKAEVPKWAKVIEAAKIEKVK
ncbi:MAG TPA: tripartite tricarboxylate transporter substrate-binding protein [Pseudolabrys sp.]|nr:tripartite tricarboxylate transporter substrate-binding protein [Pseudolabrys sp.]